MSNASDFVIENGVLKKYKGSGGDVIIPDSVTSIGNGVFYNRKNLTSVTIPDSVTSIGKNAFRDCKNLTSVTIPDSVTSIGNNAFEGCKSLRSIIIPDGVTSIDYGTFESCENLTNITIPDSVTSIHDAFEGTAWYNNHPDGFVYAGKVIYKYKGTLPKNTPIILREGTKGIAAYAFDGCKNLKSVTIPDSVTNIGHSAFFGCKSLKSVTIPDSVTSIGSLAFYGCKSLKSITIPNSVTSVGNDAFEDCTGLTSVTIPDSMTDIVDWAFSGCTNLTNINRHDCDLSDVGLDEQGGKAYDLGNQTVTARLQKDMSFLVELPNGKTAKSLPKKGADAEKYEAAKKDFAEMKKSVKMILKNRGKVLFEDFLSGKKRSAEDWQGSYLRNPLLRGAASLVVWAQGKNTFTLKDGAPVNSAEQPYTITDKPILVAHPMEMKEADTKAWQKYFTAHGLKQPFAQVWEPVRKAEDIKEDRYKDCMIPYYRFLNQEKHGITVEDNDFHNEIYINLDECDTDIERIDWNRHEINPEDRFEVHTFKFKKYSRQVNHIVAYLDRVTVWDRVRKDDLSVMDMIDGFTLAQITDFIAAAQEANAHNVLAALLEYKNNTFSDFDPMDEFTLEW